MAPKGGEAVSVVVRCRPFSRREISQDCKHIISMKLDVGQVAIKNPDKENMLKSFTFDAVYDETATQRAFYEESCFGLVESVLEGFNGTIFAYGQTGCGKTHTMQGVDTPELRGVIPNSFDHIFETIDLNRENGIDYLLRCSYLEIYNEEIRDLLSPDGKSKCDVKEDPNKGIYCKGLTNVVVNDKQVFFNVMDSGQANRTVGATLMNEGSSRSHAIFTIFIEMSEKDEKGQDHFKLGKLNLVDLAGSERATKTGASGDRLKEGAKINLSLSALGNVISALVDGKGKHIPYRDSKLTRLLQDSLGGNTKTLMVAAISPADYNYDETLSTLRYANRAKNIKNKPTINEDPKDAMLREYKMEIERLKKLLEAKESMMKYAHDVGVEKAGTEPKLLGVLDKATSRGDSMNLDHKASEEPPVDANSSSPTSPSPAPTSPSPALSSPSPAPVSALNGNPEGEEATEDSISPSPSPIKVKRSDSLPPQELQTVNEEESGHFSAQSALVKVKSKPALAQSESTRSLSSLSEELPHNSSDLTIGGDEMKESPSDVTIANAINGTPAIKLDVEGVLTASQRSPGQSPEPSPTKGCTSPMDFMGPQASSLLVGASNEQLPSLPESPTNDGSEKLSKTPSPVDKQAPTLTSSGSKPYLQPAPKVQKEVVVEVQYKDRIVEVEKLVEVEKVVKEVVEVEKIPLKHIQTQAALEEYTKSIADQRNQLGTELQLAQENARRQREEREMLAQKLLLLEQKLQMSFMGHSSNGILSPHQKKETPETILARERAEHRRAQLKAQMKQKKDAQRAAEKKKVQDEKEEMEMVLMKAVEDKEENELRMKRLKKRMEQKVTNARQEIADLTEEFEAERENLTGMLRDANKEIRLWEQVASLFLSSQEMRKVTERSVWVEEMEEWRVPALKSTRPPRVGANARLPRLPNHSDTDASDAHSTKVQSGGIRVGRSAVGVKSDRKSRSPSRKHRSKHHRSLSPGRALEESKESHHDKKSGRSSKESLTNEEREKRRRLRRQRKKLKQKEAEAAAAAADYHQNDRTRGSTTEVLAEMARTMRGQSGSGSRKHNAFTIRKYEDENWANDYRNVLNDVEEFRLFKETEDDKKETLGVRTGNSAPSGGEGAQFGQSFGHRNAISSEKMALRGKSAKRKKSKNNMKFSVPVSNTEEDDPYAMIDTDAMPASDWAGLDHDPTKLPATGRSNGEEIASTGSLWGQSPGQQQGRLPSRREERRAGRSQQDLLRSSSKKKIDDGELSQSVSVKVEGNHENSVNISFNVHIDHHKPKKPAKEKRKHRSARGGRVSSKSSTKEENPRSSRSQSKTEKAPGVQGNADAGAGNSNYTQMLEMFWSEEGNNSGQNSSRRATDPRSPYEMMERAKMF